MEEGVTIRGEIRGGSPGLEYSVKDRGSGGRNQWGFRARVRAKVRSEIRVRAQA